jgi:hypothetical protein
MNETLGAIHEKRKIKYYIKKINNSIDNIEMSILDEFALPF